MESFMKEFDPTFKKNVFDKLPTKILRIDTFRYCLLFKFGGVYADLDYEFVKPFDFSKYVLTLPLSVGNIEGDYKVNNCVLASVPNHPFLKKVLDTLSENINTIILDFEKYKRNKKLYKQFVLNSSGPGLLTNVYKKHFIQDKDIHIVEKNTFHPIQPKNKTDLKKLGPDTVGFHHCSGSWLLSLPK
jgi:mannosyltransferase OCH1-like enzyme